MAIELRDQIKSTGVHPVEAVHQVEQTGGSLLKAVSKIGTAVGKHGAKVSRGLTKAADTAERGLSAAERGLESVEAATAKAQALTDRVSAVSGQVEGIRQQFGSMTQPFDSNYSQNQLAVNSPLGSQGNFQSFGDYVCIKKSFIQDLRTLLFQLLANRDE